jgi:hypothetical protein
MRVPGLSLGSRLTSLVVAFFLAAAHNLHAQSEPAYPAWWHNQGLISGTAYKDFGAANQGEAKNFAVGAVNELDADLAQFGGAGPTLDALAVSLTATSAQTSDYSVINLGTLKNLLQPFYDRLLEVGYTLGPLSTGNYPWTAGGLSPSDYSAANIGQLKYLFNFDVTISSDGSGIPDWWEKDFFPGQTVNPNGYSSSDGLTNLENYMDGINPKVQLEVNVIVR